LSESSQLVTSLFCCDGRCRIRVAAKETGVYEVAIFGVLQLAPAVFCAHIIIVSTKTAGAKTGNRSLKFHL